MSLLRRLVDIARAQLQPASPAGSAPPQARAADAGRSESEPGGSPPPAAGAAPAEAVTQDPRLAGYYANLELPYGAPLTEVRAAWRRLIKRYHPDLHSRDPAKRQVADELTARLTEACRQLEAALGKDG